MNTRFILGTTLVLLAVLVLLAWFIPIKKARACSEYYQVTDTRFDIIKGDKDLFSVAAQEADASCSICHGYGPAVAYPRSACSGPKADITLHLYIL